MPETVVDLWEEIETQRRELFVAEVVHQKLPHTSRIEIHDAFFKVSKSHTS